MTNKYINKISTDQLQKDLYETNQSLKMIYNIKRFGKYLLKESIKFDIIYDDEIWYLENKEFNVIGCGGSLKEAKEETIKDFEFLIEYLFEEDDSKLHETALKAKQKLKVLIDFDNEDLLDSGLAKAIDEAKDSVIIHEEEIKYFLEILSK